VTFQAIVIGASADALVAAHLLARVGRRILVVEEQAPPAEDVGWVPQQVVRELGLHLTVQAPDPWATAFGADGAKLELWRDIGRCAESIRRFSESDARKWPHFCRRMAALARLFELLYTEAPANPLSVRLAMRVRGLGREGMVDLMRLLPMSVAELLDDWFECDLLKGALGAMGIVHIQQGPRSGGTAFRFLHHHVGAAAGVFRPPRSNLSALLRQRSGVERKTAWVAKIRMKSGRANGVILSDGEELDAAIVVSGVDPRRTLVELADPGRLDPELTRAITHLRSRGVAARISFKAESIGNRVIAPSLDYLERAYDEVKYGRVSSAPYLETHPTADGTDVHFQYVPYDVNEDLVAAVRRLLPSVDRAAASVMSPAELERVHGWPQGQPYHVELALDQALWMRPLPDLAQYRTPIEGLWLCGPGTHPGGGIPGASGYNCAHAILNDKR
jgi:phytoene dehydrogenase-like protein